MKTTEPAAQEAAQEAYDRREHALCVRLLADAEFQQLFMEDYLGRLIREQKKLMANAHTHDLERATARLLLLEDIRAHAALTVRAHEARIRAAQERLERIKSGRPVDE